MLAGILAMGGKGEILLRQLNSGIEAQIDVFSNIRLCSKDTSACRSPNLIIELVVLTKHTSALIHSSVAPRCGEDFQ